jgi:REP element-mobilizing transposase RayT
MQKRKRKPQQLNLIPKEPRNFGGTPRTTRKSRGKRPLSAKQTIHLTLRSTKAKGPLSLRRKRHAIEDAVRRQAAQARIKLLRLANVGNHLHLHIKLPNDVLHRDEYRRFIRAITGLIARLALNAERGAPRLARGERFWDLRPYTRVLSSWREHLWLVDYININQLEGMGVDRALAKEMVRPSILVESG